MKPKYYSELPVGYYTFAPDEVWMQYQPQDEGHQDFCESDDANRNALIAGKLYNVREISLGDCNCRIQFYGINGAFNSVNFLEELRYPNEKEELSVTPEKLQFMKDMKIHAEIELKEKQEIPYNKRDTHWHYNEGRYRGIIYMIDILFGPEIE